MCIQYTYVYKNIIFDDNDNGDNDDNNHIYISVLWMMILIKAMRMVDIIRGGYEYRNSVLEYPRVLTFSTRVSSSIY